MNKHFSIVNKRSVVYVTIGMLLLIALLGVCLSFALKGSKLWFIGVVIFGGLLLFGVLIARSVLDAGIDVIRGTVILPDIKHPERGKVPAFHVADLEDVCLCTLGGERLDPDKDKLAGAKVVFSLRNGETREYFPLSITRRQFDRLRRGMLLMASEADENF